MSRSTARDDDPTPAAIRTPGPFGFHLGLGWVILGVVWGCSRAFDRIAEPPSSALGYAGAILEALAIALAFVITGRALAIAGHRAESAIRARRERAQRSDEALLALATRAVTAFEHLADVLGRRPVVEHPVAPPDADRPRMLAEIGRAIRAGGWAEVESMLDEFDARFPGDPAIAGFRERLDAGRREEILGHLARIDAARQVNDPDRVLELYRTVESSLDLDRRGELEGELSRWFLDLIHRRLRIVPIQAEVVRLATEVATTFGATAAGASLRASLPMLRRSVGLCPRCARPYSGTAAACPQCLTGPAGGPPPNRGGPEPAPAPDADDPELEPGATTGDGRDAGWMRYDEDDRDDLDPPT
jgi:hypothetical protein